MRAMLVREGAARELYWGEAPTPEPGPGAVLVEVYATAVNRADLLQRRGLYPPPPGEPDILGLEVAGVVAAKGRGVAKWQIGDRVCALLAGGGYAQYVAVHEDMLLPVPSDLDFEQAAAIPEVFYTAFITLVLEAGLEAGERVLVHAGGSGVGTATIQMARQRGAHVVVTAGSNDKLARCRELGADGTINYKTEDFAERVRALTGGEGMDVILDCVGGAYLEKNLAALRVKGRLVIIGLMGGAKAEINLALVVGKRLRVIGSVLRARPLAEKIAITAAFKAQVLPLLASRQIRPVIDSVYPITEVEKAHEHVAANRNFGKVVLRVVAGG
jgi:putative PIG3 family NAD(P)H quinone oxidoreductase